MCSSVALEFSSATGVVLHVHVHVQGTRVQGLNLVKVIKFRNT